MSYVQGFVLAVPTAKREEYRAMAERFGRIFREWGALSVVEAWGEDVPDGQLTSFPMAVKKADDETVVFAWIVWPSREVCDAAHRKMETDDRMPKDMSAMPFDTKRMIFGGFVPIVEL